MALASSMALLSDLEQKRSVWNNLEQHVKINSLTIERRELIRRLKDTYVPKWDDHNHHIQTITQFAPVFLVRYTDKRFGGPGLAAAPDVSDWRGAIS